jgi:ring-1,2-phenylacetyl-CoA epoxidase subunit PaaD
MTTTPAAVTVNQIWSVLDQIKDPEIPVVSLVELGVARAVQLDGDKVIVTITPTFAGCPAMHYMREQIVEQLHAIGVEQIEVRTSLNPPWTSEWLSDEVRSKIKSIGLAPPPRLTNQPDLEIALMEVVACPFCGSKNTSLENAFGPTLCKSMHYCRNCHQSFERFKPM